MKKTLEIIIIVAVVIAGIILGFSNGIDLSNNQIATLKILGYIYLGSVLYCFLVGEISRNYSIL